ncbi:MAG: hypothetical protein P4L53_27890 [Candidatus Obscuribacterales bacterium]|nr:hypothetical protein [Candidatus Obscuribacterales bacterium]
MTLLTWLVPLLVLIALVAIEAAKAYEISRDLQIGASLAARALASSGSLTTQQQQSQILSDIQVGKNVVDPSQFYSVIWQRNTTPPTVTVFVQSVSTGPQKPPHFPDPDPLNLGSQFVMKAQSTFRLMQ